MKRYEIAPEARSDLDAVWDYLGVEKQNPTAAHRQIEVFYSKFSLLAANPFMGEARNDLGTNLRSFGAGNYVVVYRTTGSKIEIARVIHAARDIRAVFGVGGQTA
jgi:toxin ParE1/3/4